MEPIAIQYISSTYVYTKQHCKISRSSKITGSQNLVTKGKDIIQKGVVLRGDLASIHIGMYVILRENCMIKPTFNFDTKKKGRKEFSQCVIGDNVYIDTGTVVCAT